MNRNKPKIRISTIDAKVRECPFCGNNAVVKKGAFYHVICEICGSDTMFYGAEHDLIKTAKRWGRRANEA